MLTNKMNVGIAAAIMVSGLLSTTGATAQSLWSDRSRPSALSLQLMRPVYTYDGQAVGIVVGYLDIRIDVNEVVNFVVEVPLSVYDRRGSSSHSATIGNPYAGFEFGGANSQNRLEVGLRLPLAVASAYPALWSGLFSDISRFGAFLPDAYMFQAIADLRTPSVGGAYLRLRAGPQIAFSSKGGPHSEVYGNYALIGGYDGEVVRFGAGISGLALLTEDDLGFDERTVHQLQINADFGKGQLRPGVFANFWLDEGMREDVPFVFGFALNYGI